jgi:hypothetical protein
MKVWLSWASAAEAPNSVAAEIIRNVFMANFLSVAFGRCLGSSPVANDLEMPAPGHRFLPQLG